MLFFLFICWWSCKQTNVFFCPFPWYPFSLINQWSDKSNPLHEKFQMKWEFWFGDCLPLPLHRKSSIFNVNLCLIKRSATQFDSHKEIYYFPKLMREYFVHSMNILLEFHPRMTMSIGARYILPMDIPYRGWAFLEGLWPSINTTIFRELQPNFRLPPAFIEFQ